MKMKIMVAAILAAISTSSVAQYVGTLPPNIEAGFNYTTDSDKFTTNAWNVGAAVSNGVGIRYGEQRSRGINTTVVTTTDRQLIDPGTVSISQDQYGFDVTQTSRELRLTFVHVDEDFEVRGSVGPKNVISSARFNKKSNTTTTAPLVVSPPSDPVYVQSSAFVQGGSLTDTHTTLVADAELRLILTDSLTVSASLSRDTVDTATAVALSAAGTLTMVDTASVDMDLQLSDNLSTYLQMGVSHFSDSNNRMFVQSKTTYTILPEYGVSVYARLKYQHDSDPRTGNTCGEAKSSWQCAVPPYYSPDQRYSASPGIQIRQAHDGLVYTASAEVGKQWTTVVGDTSTATIYSWQLGIQTQPGKRTGNTFGVNLFGTNASQLSGSPNYHWYGLYSWMKVPF